MLDAEILSASLYDDGIVTEVIRPSAIVPESSARAILVELALADVRRGGTWSSSPTRWIRYDKPWTDSVRVGNARQLGTIDVTYGTPSRYDITIYRAALTQDGVDQGWSIEALCNDALRLGGLHLSSCPRASLAPPPPPFRP